MMPLDERVLDRAFFRGGVVPDLPRTLIGERTSESILTAERAREFSLRRPRPHRIIEGHVPNEWEA